MHSYLILCKEFLTTHLLASELPPSKFVNSTFKVLFDSCSEFSAGRIRAHYWITMSGRGRQYKELSKTFCHRLYITDLCARDITGHMEPMKRMAVQEEKRKREIKNNRKIQVVLCDERYIVS